MPAPDADRLRADLIHRFRDADAPLPDRDFNQLALRVFARNFDAVPAYAAYCRARGRTPDDVTDWKDVPAVPTAAFKELPLRAEDRPVERVFRTSGTTRGRERRGEHHVADLALYRASLRATFRAHLLPDDARLPFLSLMPPADALPDSSLAYMITDVLGTFGADGSAVFASADPDRGLDHQGLATALSAACDDGRPVLLIGTSAAFIHWLDRLVAEARTFALPAGSRLMDTGGYKGAGRRVDPAALRDLYRTCLGLHPAAYVNEYGMTELLSQWYDDTLRRRHHGAEGEGGEAGEVGAAGDIAGAGGNGPVRKRGPGWLRSVAVDPETLAPLPPGESGILRHVDLANLDSVAAVQTEDFGRVDGHGLIVEGRAAGAPPRGCSIAMDLLLEEAG